MVKRFCLLSVVAIMVTFITTGISFSAAPFYEGKTLRIIVGMSPGGGYDIYARAIARHLGKHIPGQPTVIVENMPGAGSLVGANHIFKIAKPDGLTIGHFNGGLFFNQVAGQPGVEFDARKFLFIGCASRENNVFALTKASGINTVENWMTSKRPMKLGGIGPGNQSDTAVRVVKVALGLPLQLISGYRGTAEIKLAAESGELDGGAWAWDSIKVMWQDGLESGDVSIVMQSTPKPIPDLAKVPLTISFAKTEEARQLIEVGIHNNSAIVRPFVFPPGTSGEKLGILRKAFQETLRDKDFVAETMKAKISIDPVTGEELEKTVGGLFKLEPVLFAKLKDILFK